VLGVERHVVVVPDEPRLNPPALLGHAALGSLALAGEPRLNPLPLVSHAPLCSLALVSHPPPLAVTEAVSHDVSVTSTVHTPAPAESWLLGVCGRWEIGIPPPLTHAP
jgi:hypothetical protein